MRLIDEEILMNEIRKTITEQSSTIDWMNLIHRQPVAYDIDNVVKQLEQSKHEVCLTDDALEHYCDGVDRAIEIVEGGIKQKNLDNWPLEGVSNYDGNNVLSIWDTMPMVHKA